MRQQWEESAEVDVYLSIYLLLSASVSFGFNFSDFATASASMKLQKMRFLTRRPCLRLLVFGILFALVFRVTVYFKWLLHINELSIFQMDPTGPLRGQHLVDYIAAKMAVRYYREADGKTFLSLTNAGAFDIPATRWTIYFNHAEAFADVAHTGSRYMKDIGLILRHLDGWLFSLEPVLGAGNASFKLRPNETLFIRESVRIKSKSYLFPKWYVIGDGLEPRIIQSTNMDKLNVEGSVETWPSAHRYDRYEVQDLKRATRAIIPTPLEMKHNNEIKLNKNWKIVYQKGLQEEAAFTSDKLSMTSYESENIDAQIAQTISLAVRNLSAHFTKFHEGLHIDEGYVIKIEPNTISIRGQTSRGVFYGVQSLVSLLEGSNDGISLSVSEIVDAPRQEFRGLMLDVARNFIEKDEIIRTLDLMAMYKLNKLHLHLTDDQGWRIEIPTLPELTEIGSRRGHDPNQENNLLPYLGFGPKSKQQYYSVQDYQDILRHANLRHIEVIPEVDMPGHAHAAVQAMRMRHLRLKRSGSDEETASKFLVHDPNDTSWYLAVNQQKDTVLNPCLQSTYTFIREVLQSIVATHKVVQPLRTFHFGGDEVPNKALLLSPVCNNLIQLSQELKGNLKLYFMKRVVSIANEFGVGVQTWEDGLSRHEETPVEAAAWDSQVGVHINAWKLSPAAHWFANAKYKVVLTHAHRLYLDHPNEPDAEELGLFWATRFIDSRLIFEFMYSRNLGNSSFANEETCRIFGIQQCQELKHPENIIGMQASLWGEMIRTTADAHYMMYPRLLAFAERAWHMADWETAVTDQQMTKLRDVDWTNFANTIGYKELRRLERLGINYRLSTPGVRAKEGKVEANTEFPGSLIQYSVDGGLTWNSYTEGVNPITYATDNLKFSVVSFDLKRRGRVIGIS